MTRIKLTPSVPFQYNNKVILKSSDVRIYKDVVILTPGVWTDASTRMPIEYTELNLMKGSKVWSSNFLNVDHSWGTLDRIGYVKNPYYNKKIGIMGDLHIRPITQTARDTISLIDAGLVNWLSAELMAEDVWDSASNKRFAEDIEFIGCAVVCHPADKNTRIKADGPTYKRD